ncbi:MAG TPA: S41 family peptidase, partial [Gammaproteobacteria bacterium]
HSIQFRGKLAGIGARIGIRDERLTLITVYPGSPADLAGLRDHDVVARIDGMSTTNLAVSDAVHRIRGRVGTAVVLTIEREGRDEPKSYSVTRDLVTIPSVTAKRLENGVIYTEISHFSQTTPADFRERVSVLASKDVDPRGVIIDLRRNSGGSMLGSSSIGDLFLDDALLITTAGRSGNSVSGLTAEIRAKPDTPFAAYPVAVLTSPRTASGSELLAASLRNNDRALVFGERTFGKGTVQKTYSLDADSSLKLTVGHFLPNGLAIPGEGMTPDVEVRRFGLGPKRFTPPAGRVRDDAPFWLMKPSWLTTETTRDPIVLTFVEELEDDGEENSDMASDPDKDDPASQPIVALAAEVLARYGDVSAAKTLTASRLLLHQRTREADEALARRLEKKAIDWRLPREALVRAAGRTHARVEIRTTEGLLRAGNSERIEFLVTNDGDRPLYRAYATISSKTPFLRGQGLLLGAVEPGDTRSWSIEVDVPKTAGFARADVVVQLHDATGFVASSAPLLLAIEPIAQPSLAYRVSVAGSQDDAQFTIHVELENRGSEATGEVRAFLRHPDSEEIELLAGTATVEKLTAGQRAGVDLRVRTSTSFASPPELDLIISEADYRVFVETKVVLAESESRWKAPPSVALERIVRTGDGIRLVARVSDDSGIAAVWSTIGGEQTQHLDLGATLPRLVRIEMPWDPGPKIKPIVVHAADSDGLRNRLGTGL